MATKRSQSKARKPRTDAQRNRERILEAAKQAFSQSGANASLDEIAKEAGVGPGTLYRHFPTREDLLEAVYPTEVEKLAAAERKFAETLPPVEAFASLDAIVCRLHRCEADYRACAQCALVGDPKKVFEAS
jgi:AcrR family transcriptional regulator